MKCVSPCNTKIPFAAFCLQPGYHLQGTFKQKMKPLNSATSYLKPKSVPTGRMTLDVFSFYTFSSLPLCKGRSSKRWSQGGWRTLLSGEMIDKEAVVRLPGIGTRDALSEPAESWGAWWAGVQFWLSPPCILYEFTPLSNTYIHVWIYAHAHSHTYRHKYMNTKIHA
jgi:hypothetical protein